MKALSIRQPWAWLILLSGKDIENRTWKTNYRGRILIHASAQMTTADYSVAREVCTMVEREMPRPKILLPHRDSKSFDRGCIVGSVEIVDCVESHDSPWFAAGMYGWVLRNPMPWRYPVKWKGQLGLFEVGNIGDSLRNL